MIIVLAVLFRLGIGGGWLYRSCCGSSRRVVVVEEQPEESATAIIALRETHIYVNPAPLIYNNPPPPYYNDDEDQINEYPPKSQNYTDCQPLQFPTPEPLPNCPS